MKKLSAVFVLSILSLVFFATPTQAQAQTQTQAQTQATPADYFAGTWNVKAYELPQGDTDLIIRFEKKEGSLSGGLVDAATKAVTPFTKIELAANKVTAYFIAPEQQMEVYLTLEKKDDTQVTGSIMDMFKMAGTKAK